MSRDTHPLLDLVSCYLDYFIYFGMSGYVKLHKLNNSFSESDVLAFLFEYNS